MKISLPPLVFQIIGILGLVGATLLGIWFLSVGQKESNQLFTNLGYIVAVVGASPMILVLSPPQLTFSAPRAFVGRQMPMGGRK